MQAVILCGGTGTRLWPLSRENYPKQFISLDGKGTLFKDTILRERIINSNSDQKPIIVTNKDQKSLAKLNLRDLGIEARFIIEPLQRNTAAAIAAVALNVIAYDPILIVLPSDQFLQDPDEFKQKVNIAEALALDGKLVTFGVVPTRPEVGYGYIKTGKLINNNVYEISKFVEKPTLASAELMISTREYLWNSGIFVFKASVYLSELQKYKPNIYKWVKKAIEIEKQKDPIEDINLNSEYFSKCESTSIDYAVFEKTEKGVVIPIDQNWSDLGTWNSIYLSKTKDSDNNVIEGDVYSLDTQNCFLKSSKRLIAAIGLSNLAVIETEDAILVTSLSKTQLVKDVVEHLKKNGREEAISNAFVNRPWGGFIALDKEARFQVKRICVSPGEELSLQKHYHRSEHWIVVQGTAEVVIENEKKVLTENQSVYIPLGAKHQLKNPGKISLILVEIQSGAYLGEDDIVRYYDKYNRC